MTEVPHNIEQPPLLSIQQIEKVRRITSDIAQLRTDAGGRSHYREGITGVTANTTFVSVEHELEPGSGLATGVSIVRTGPIDELTAEPDIQELQVGRTVNLLPAQDPLTPVETETSIIYPAGHPDTQSSLPCIQLKSDPTTTKSAIFPIGEDGQPFMSPLGKAETQAARSSLLTFEEVKDDLSQIQVGDTVTGFSNLMELDCFVAALVTSRGFTTAEALRASLYNRVQLEKYTLSANNGSPSVPLWDGKVKLPSKALWPKLPGRKTFNGELVNIAVTLIDDHRSVGPLGSFPGYSIDMLLSANLYSTGRGIVGKSLQFLTVATTILRASYKKLPGDNANLAADVLFTESSANARQVAIDGIRNAASAGLPTLGRRR